mgnify:CR=1 FL=1
MPELRELCDKIEQETASLREKVSARKWAELSRRGFIYNVENILPGIEELYALFQIAGQELGKSAESNAPKTLDHERELNQLITSLRRNREMEEARIRKSQEKGLLALAETITVPELYSDLEQKTLSMLLKSNYLAERIRIFERKKEPMMNVKGAQRNVLDLLEKREIELQNLRKKYEDTRKNFFLGLVEKNTTIDLENDMNELAKQLETQTALMKKSMETYKETFTELERHNAELGQKTAIIEETQAQMSGKMLDVMTALKKERDYAKKIVMETEHETLQLRNTYSKELLGLQEEKMGIRNALGEKYEKQLAELKHDNKDKNELIRHFQETVSGKERKIAQLEEENLKLSLIGKTIEKHQKAKEKFLKKEKKKRK